MGKCGMSSMVWHRSASEVKKGLVSSVWKSKTLMEILHLDLTGLQKCALSLFVYGEVFHPCQHCPSRARISILWDFNLKL